MPNRIIREGILSSDRIDKLDAESEVFYRRLLSKVDDHGLFDARLSILKASLYPLKLDKISESDIAKWLKSCVENNLITVYISEEKLCLKVLDTNWKIRSASKYPQTIVRGLLANEINCKQLRVYTLSLFKSLSKTYTLSLVSKDNANSPPPELPAAGGSSGDAYVRPEEVDGVMKRLKLKKVPK